MRSQVANRPVTVIPTNNSAAMGTAMNGERPKYAAPRLTPMNSVVMVRKLSRNRSPTEKNPQNLPKRSKMSRACPTPVTAPSRTTISWLTMSTGMSSKSVHNRLVPWFCPACA